MQIWDTLFVYVKKAIGNADGFDKVLYLFMNFLNKKAGYRRLQALLKIFLRTPRKV